MRLVIRLVLLVGLILGAGSLSPLAVADQTGPAAAEPASASATTPTSRDSASKNAAAQGAKPAAGPITTIVRHPTNPQTGGAATFSWKADVKKSSGVQFRCRLSGPGHPANTPVGNCPPASHQSSGKSTTGTRTFSRLKASRKPYTFTVQAYIPAKSGHAAIIGRSDFFRWRMFSLYAPDHYSPPAGARFNNPLGGRKINRRNLTHVIRTIDSMPGYRQAYPGFCPGSVRNGFGTVRVSLYSMTDYDFARAMVGAAHRCISVQILMNNHLSSKNDPAWHYLSDALGGNTRARNFAHRCSFGCRGSGVLHTKMYLFNSTVHPRRSLNKIVRTVMVGSTNMTSNAAKVQWNDIYTVRNQPKLFAQYSTMFASMAKDSGFRRQHSIAFAPPTYQTTFWPFRKGATDPYLSALRSVHCTGANGGTGVRGHSAVYINMHAWFNSRGLALADQVRKMSAQGCRVHVLYSFMSYAVFKKLHNGTSASVRRTLFSNNGVTASVYSHFKNIAVSGYVGSDHSARVAWTGSNNFTNEGTHFDEIMVRIASPSAFNSYRNQFDYMRNRLSSATYANFSEPSGGGRAPRRTLVQPGTDPTLRTPASELPPPGTPTIESPAITFDAAGRPHALD